MVVDVLVFGTYPLACMIRVFFGLPRNGKSYNAQRHLVEELLHGDRYILTNMAILKTPLLSYLAEHGKEDEFARVVRLSKSDTRRFWRKAPGAVWEVDDFGDLVCKKQSDKPCLVIIDEAHFFFSPAKMQVINPELSELLSQHAKFGWDIIFITQDPDRLTKGLRNLVEEWVKHVNTARRRLFGFRGKKGGFVTMTWIGCEPSERKAPEKVPFLIDKKIAETYDTSAGIGVGGGGDADKFAKLKGLPPWLIPVGLLLLGVVGYFVLSSVPKLIRGGLNAAMGGAESAVTNFSSAATSFVPSLGGSSQSSSGPSLSVIEEPIVEMRKRTDFEMTSRGMSKIDTYYGVTNGFRSVPVNSYVPQLPVGGPVANPDAPQVRRAFRILGFDGRVHRVVRSQVVNGQGDFSEENSGLEQE